MGVVNKRFGSWFRRLFDESCCRSWLRRLFKRSCCRSFGVVRGNFDVTHELVFGGENFLTRVATEADFRSYYS